MTERESPAVILSIPSISERYLPRQREYSHRSGGARDHRSCRLAGPIPPSLFARVQPNRAHIQYAEGFVAPSAPLLPPRCSL